MRVLFAGLGSIGQSHIKDLAAELAARGIEYEIEAVRSSSRALPDDIAPLVKREYRSYAELGGEYDIAYITNPTSLHSETIAALSSRVRAMFIEKPVFMSPEVDINALSLRADGIYYVACPLRFSSAVERVKAIAKDNKIIAARALCSSYLPGWRRTGDYRECYSAHRALGGGVELDLVHEWDYLADIFGAPLEVTGFGAKCSSLEIDSDDVAVYIARYRDMLLSLHIDYIGRLPRREIELYTDDETYVCDIIANTVSALRAGTNETLEARDIKKAETAYFVSLALVETKRNINTIDNAVKTLRLALRAAKD